MWNMKKIRKVYLFMSCNERWISHLTVAINSAKFHTSCQLHLFFCVKDKNREIFFRDILEWFVTPNFSFEILIPNNAHLELLFEGKVTDFPTECYYRLLIGTFVPEYVKKIIYLDCDIIVNGDLGVLYDFPITTTIAATEDIYGSQHCSKLLFKHFWVVVEKYINNWVMLIDLNKYRRNHKEAAMSNILLKMGKHLPKTIDQDLFNLIFVHDITFLDTSWNAQILYGVIPKNIQHVYIYHVYWKLKADSPFYHNRKLQLLYYKYLYIEHHLNIFYYLTYFFVIFPLKKFLFIKTKLYFQATIIQKKELLSIFWILYPPVTVILMVIIFKSIKRIGIKKFAVKLLQLFRLSANFYT